MITQKNNFLWNKSNALLRYLLVHTCSNITPLYIVNEYPKSGGTWLAQMLSEILKIPFPRNRLPMLRPSIIHGHMMHKWNMKNLVLLWRDGRDVLISQYYHWLFKNDRGNERLVHQCRKDLAFPDYDDISNNLPAFMEYVYLNPRSPKFTWAEFVDNWFETDQIISVRYEDLLEDAAIELQRIYFHLFGVQLDIDLAEEVKNKYSFKAQHGRSPGNERVGSFARKGVSGDWENHFSRQAKHQFNQLAGNALIKLGYESDSSWLNNNVSNNTFVKVARNRRLVT